MFQQNLVLCLPTVTIISHLIIRFRDDNDDDPPFRGGWTTKDGEKSKPKPEPAPVTNPR